MSSDTDTIKLKIEVREDGSMVITNLQKKIKKSTGAVNEFEKGSKKLHGSLGSLWKQFTIGHLAADVFRSGLQAIKRTIHDVIQSASGFEKEFANVTTLLSGDALDSTGMMEEGLLDMAGELGSATELTKGLYQTLSAGIAPGAEALEFLAESAKFAQASLADTATAVDVVTTVVNAYGRKASDVTYILDILFQTIKDGKITGQELAQSLGRAIPAAATLGVELKEITSAMAVMTKGGIKANEAATALNATFMTILRPTEQAAKLARKMGVEMSKAGIEGAGGLQKWLALLKDKIGDNEKALANLFPNVEALKMLFGLTGTQAAEYAAQMERMNDVVGNTEEAFQKQIETFDGASIALKNMIEAVFIKALLPALKDLATWMRENKDDIVAFVKGVADAVSYVAETTGGVIKLLSNPLQALHEKMQQIDHDRAVAAGHGINYNRSIQGQTDSIKSQEGWLGSLIASGERHRKQTMLATGDTKLLTSEEKKLVQQMTAWALGLVEVEKEMTKTIPKISKTKKEVKTLSDAVRDLCIQTVTATGGGAAGGGVDDLTNGIVQLEQATTKETKAVADLWAMMIKYGLASAKAEIEQEKFNQALVNTIYDIANLTIQFIGLMETMGLSSDVAQGLGQTISGLAGIGTGIINKDPVAVISGAIELIGGLFKLFEGKDPVEEAMEDWNALIEEGKEGTYEMWEFLHRDYVLLGEEIEEIMDYQQEKIHEGLEALSDYYEYAATSQERFNHAQIYTMAIFAGLVASGYTFVEAIREMKDEFGQLLDIIAETGYTADESFQFLLNIADFIEQNEALANALSSVSIMLKSAFESGALSLTQLQAMIYTAGADFTSMYHEAIAAGATQEEAYALIAEPLSDLIFYATEHNLKIDDQTAALIAEMQAAGYLTELQIPEDVKQTWLLEEMLKIMGGTIPYLLEEINSTLLQEVHSGGDNTVPGYPDRTIKEYATGGEFWTTGPEMIMVGEGDEIEKVVITPKSRYHSEQGNKGGNMGSRSVTLHVAGGINVYGVQNPEQLKEQAAIAISEILDENVEKVSDKIYELAEDN